MDARHRAGHDDFNVAESEKLQLPCAAALHDGRVFDREEQPAGRIIFLFCEPLIRIWLT